MNYPGNQGQAGGRPPEQPPQPPHGPGRRRAGAPPHGRSPYDPPAGDDGPFAPRPGESYGSTEPYRRSGGYEQDQYGQGQYGQTPHEQAPYGQAPYGQTAHEQTPHEQAPYGRAPHERAPYEPAGEDDPSTRTYGLPGESGHRGPTPPGRRGNMPLVAGAAVLAGIVLIAGGVAISNALEGDPAPVAAKSPAASGPSGAASPSASPAPTRPIGGLGNSRTTDASPLTLAEVFRNRTFRVGASRYTMTARRADRNCARTVNGARLVTALRRGYCNQVIRATFASADGKLIGTIGVANLRTATAAKSATRVWSAKDAWVQPVPGTGVTKTIGKGSALGTFQFKGHYLLMTWVQQPSGKDIPSSQHRVISKFGQDVMLGSGLFEALNYRGNVGKPLQK